MQIDYKNKEMTITHESGYVVKYTSAEIQKQIDIIQGCIDLNTQLLNILKNDLTKTTDS